MARARKMFRLALLGAAVGMIVRLLKGRQPASGSKDDLAAGR